MADSKLVCLHCALEFSAADGRQHGRHFRCKNCESASRQIRRNLDSSDLENFTPEEQRDFFRKLAEEKQSSGNGRVPWSNSPGILAHCHDQQDHEWLPQWRPRKETSFGGLGEQRLERRNNSTHTIRVQWRIRLWRFSKWKSSKRLGLKRMRRCVKGLCNRSSKPPKRKVARRRTTWTSLQLLRQAARTLTTRRRRRKRLRWRSYKPRIFEWVPVQQRLWVCCSQTAHPCTVCALGPRKCPDHVPAPVLQTAQTVLTKLDSWAKDARACMNKDESQKSLPEGSELQALSLAFSPEDLIKDDTEAVRGSFQVGPQSLASEGREGQSRPEAAGGGPGAGSQAPVSHRKERWVNVRLHVIHAISFLSRRWDEIHCRSHSRRWRFCAWEFN